MAEYILGMNGSLYCGTSRATWGALGADGVHHEGAAPTGLSEVTKAMDVSFNVQADTADVTTRGNNGWKATVATLKDAEIKFNLIYDPADAQVALIQKSFVNGSNIALAVLDGDKATADTKGFWAMCMITGMDKGEELGEAMTYDVTAKPTLDSVAPEFVKVTTP